MYIPTWIIVIIIIAGVYFYTRYKKRTTASAEDESLTFEQMWGRAEGYMKIVLMKSPNLENYLQDERDMVRAMERDMIRLRERYKHEPIKQLEIARDWMDYSNAVSEIKFARERLDVDMEETAYDSFDERTKEPYVTVQEVAKRVEEILGKDSSSKLVHDRLRKHAEAANEVLIKASKRMGKEEK